MRAVGLLGNASIAIAATVLSLMAIPGAEAQQSRVMPLAQVKAIMQQTRSNWLSFRNYGGRQLIYFSHIISWHCGISEIRYSINSTALDRRFPVPKCNPALPNNIASGDKIYLDLPPASARTVSVQIVYEDGSSSDIFTYQPCAGAGEATCAALVEETPGGGSAAGAE